MKTKKHTCKYQKKMKKKIVGSKTGLCRARKDLTKSQTTPD